LDYVKDRKFVNQLSGCEFIKENCSMNLILEKTKIKIGAEKRKRRNILCVFVFAITPCPCTEVLHFRIVVLP
jgi:hypothetical protein